MIAWLALSASEEFQSPWGSKYTEELYKCLKTCTGYWIKHWAKFLTLDIESIQNAQWY